ncbi:hypothetical protein AWB75_02927 [Caballeronia catudaia]|uniref:Uncharacterized protein n=1 Tax=Caballeronia catudaia TaxID=1777136 RepID=A0A158B3I9_9BURK|nr:hypothetical protein [Caballeronia catudaia]SAK64326.1 hypothetical protein AWB75_02927 [Caballeronia catudaia]
MPIDLSEAGEPYPYPAHGPRLLPWLGIWLACGALGVPLMLLAWPASEPASGVKFWFAVIGVPNLVFLALLCIGRIGYEALWYHAHNRNTARAERLGERLRIAQKPLQILGVGYCVPSVTTDLATLAMTTTPVFKSQAARSGVGFIVHNRFEEESWSDDPQSTTEPDSNPDNHSTEPPRRIATVVLKLVKALEPLAPAIQALSQYGPAYAPLVRVLAHPDEADQRQQQALDALRIAGLSALECEVVPESHNLMLADAWLDSRERRAVLILAFTWHDANPPANSSEAAIAVLLNAGFYQLPESVPLRATLHRPVEHQADAATLRELIRNAALWGQAEPQAITHAWITRLTADHDRTLLDTLKHASFAGIVTRESHGRLDRLLGNAGAAITWLSIAAAIESAKAGPHLILDQQQAAILYVHQNSLHDHAEQQSESA